MTENWLKHIQKTKEEYTIEQKVIDLHKESNFMYRRGCGKINDQEKELFKKWTSIQDQRNRGKAESQKVELFQTRQNPLVLRPSHFMIDYIEATHNLFQIQQKRFDELENVVAELSAKIE